MDLLKKKHAFQISFSVSLHDFLIVFFSLFLILYTAWELYWYKKVSLSFIKWHTHLIGYIYAIFILFSLFNNTKKENGKNILLPFLSIFSICFFIELLLILTGFTRTHNEINLGYYLSEYNSTHNDYYVNWASNTPHHLKTTEFDYVRNTNSLGLSDKEWLLEKKTHSRILALGDSFVEGDGAPFDSSYVSILSSILNADSLVVELMNAGVCGSDPFQNYIDYKERLFKYKPEILFQSLNSFDVLHDISVKGGLERFKKKPFLTFRSPPWWEPIYASSYLSRIFFLAFGFNSSLVKTPLNTYQKDTFNKELIELFYHYDKLCIQNGAMLYVIIRPSNIDEAIADYPFYDFTYMIKSLETNSHIKFINLIPYYKQYFKITGESIDDYYWKQDGHHNSKGYLLMAKLTAKAIYQGQ